MSLLELLPENYQNSAQVVEIQNAFGAQAETVKAAKDDLFSQLFVDTATWGLTAWEKALGINTDVTKPYDFRRERIKAKLRGTGTTTRSMIKQTAVAYSNGEVEVIEDTTNYNIVIKFVGTKGIPQNIDDLTLTINEIKPSHLSFTYEYTYNTWEMISDATWETLYSKTWEAARTY